MRSVTVKFKKVTSWATIPKRATDGSAGLDLYASLLAPVIVDPMSQAVIGTDIAVCIPLGFEGQVRPRSGLAATYCITVTNSPGTIDSDFRGPIGVMLFNLSNRPYVINHSDRIAQLVISEVPRVLIEEVTELPETRRGSGGFGSSGK